MPGAMISIISSDQNMCNMRQNACGADGDSVKHVSQLRTSSRQTKTRCQTQVSFAPNQSVRRPSSTYTPLPPFVLSGSHKPSTDCATRHHGQVLCVWKEHQVRASTIFTARWMAGPLVACGVTNQPTTATRPLSTAIVLTDVSTSQFCLQFHRLPLCATKPTVHQGAIRRSRR